MWTLFKTDVGRLHAFLMRFLRRILGVRWFNHIANAQVKERTRLEDIEPKIWHRRLAFFEHMARLQPGVPARDALWTAVSLGSQDHLGLSS